MTKTKSDQRTVEVTIPGDGKEAAVRLNHNGSLLTIERNVPTKVSPDELQALRHSQYGSALIVGGADAPAAEAEEQTPAPGNGGAGDAGGGGGSTGGSPAAEITPPEGEGVEVTLPEGFLDRSAKDIAADLGGLTPAELARAKADEEAGKTRKSVIAAIDAAIAAQESADA